MAKRLEGKVAIVTGGGAGIGAATARIFCAEGAKVLLVDRDAEALQRSAEAIRTQVAGAQVEAATADIANLDQCTAAVRRAVEAFGKVDTLVNNAGIRTRISLAEAGQTEWQRILEVNLLGAVNFFKTSLPELRRAGRASIVNVSSVYAVTGRRDMGLYDATKAAMLALTRTMAFEEAAPVSRERRLPGSTLTDYHLTRGQSSGRDRADMQADVKTDSLLRRWATPEEVAFPILWLASEEASFITGASFIVDGGLSIM